MLKTIDRSRVRSGAIASVTHLLASVLVGICVAALVFFIWYPYPYGELSGGRNLFLIVISVDVISGPLLTAVLFNPEKRRSELWRDLGVVVLIQFGALAYGVHAVWLARPLFLVMEVDRFKVVGTPDLQDEAAQNSLKNLPAVLTPKFWSGPVIVGIREPKDAQERMTVLFESIQGGRDYGHRPEFYTLYDAAASKKSLIRAKPLLDYLDKQPSQRIEAITLASEKHVNINQWMFVPVVGRQDWIAILDKQGKIQGFLHGNGF